MTVSAEVGKKHNTLIRLELRPSNIEALGGLQSVYVFVKVSTADHMFKCIMGLDLKPCVSFSVARVMTASFMVQQTQTVLQQSFAKNLRQISFKPVLKYHWNP